MAEDLVPSARASARNILIAPRKARIVVDLIRGKPADEALAVLKYLPRKGSLLVEKVLRSAMANASQNHNMKGDLYVHEAYVDQGPVLKRYHPRQRGQAFSIKKRLSHITVVVRERGEA